ncbi:MAG: hypothetical protein IKH41_08670, partial [Clostridia bacterium]|nr:hypothetical protein [Clostridia bacterium]
EPELRGWFQIVHAEQDLIIQTEKLPGAVRNRTVHTILILIAPSLGAAFGMLALFGNVRRFLFVR